MFVFLFAWDNNDDKILCFFSFILNFCLRFHYFSLRFNLFSSTMSAVLCVVWYQKFHISNNDRFGCLYQSVTTNMWSSVFSCVLHMVLTWSWYNIIQQHNNLWLNNSECIIFIVRISILFSLYSNIHNFILSKFICWMRYF